MNDRRPFPLNCELFLPGVRFLVNADHPFTLQRLREAFSPWLLESPCGALPSTTVCVTGIASDSHPVPGPQARAVRLAQGFRLWRADTADDRPSRAWHPARDERRITQVSDGQLSARLEASTHTLRVDIKLHRARLAGSAEPVERLAGVLLPIITSSLGLCPIRGATARFDGDTPAPGFTEPEPHRRQLLVIGSPSLVAMLSSELELASWTVSPHGAHYLQRNEDDRIEALAASAALPLTLPGTVLHLAAGEGEAIRPASIALPTLTEDPIASQPNRPPAFRRLFFQLQNATLTPPAALDALGRQLEQEVLRDLALRAHASSVEGRPEDPAATVAAALAVLGLRDLRGWNLRAPTTFRRGPVAIPRRFSYYVRVGGSRSS